jgi:hypothetical protein
MKLFKAGLSGLAAIIFLGLTCTVGGSSSAEGQLHWQLRKKEELHVRIVAMALTLPRSSFFTTHEVFIAEKQLDKDKEEWSLVKLVYQFLPYQPRLSEYGMDYSRVHELRAVRDPECDETLAKMTPEKTQDDESPAPAFKYSTDSPISDLERRRTPLPCYETSADDYSKSFREELPRPDPTLQVRH